MADDLYYPDLSGDVADKQFCQKVRDAIKILYDSVYELGGRKGQQAIFQNQVKVDGNVAVSKEGGALEIRESGNLELTNGTSRSDASMGSVKLASGSAVVTSSLIRNNSRVFLTPQDGASSGSLRVSARETGKSFTITSSDGSDARTVAWLIVQPHGAVEREEQKPKTEARRDDRSDPHYRTDYYRRNRTQL